MQMEIFGERYGGFWETDIFQYSKTYIFHRTTRVRLLFSFLRVKNSSYESIPLICSIGKTTLVSRIASMLKEKVEPGEIAGFITEEGTVLFLFIYYEQKILFNLKFDLAYSCVLDLVSSSRWQTSRI